jgi:two-component system, NtrC family, response regulator HydG
MPERGNREKAVILIACEDVAYATALENFIASADHEIVRCHDAAGVLRLSSRHDFDIIVLDLDLGTGADVDLMSFIRQRNPATRLILLFDIARIEQAIEGLRQGAFFYLPRTGPPSDVSLVVDKALYSSALQSAVEEYEQNVFEELVGQTEAMQRVVELIRKVAPTDSTVLLLGESGTGKEVLANTIHRLSRRKDQPFIAVNCAALPEALLESELFGHVKGSFTGADRDKPGLFEEADGGTVFLDEIGDMSPITQAKLLRVLQNGEIRRVGSSLPQRVDVRVIAATNRDLVKAVENNAFREDLYFRLNVIQIRIPPLRERMDALPTLINHFISRHNSQFQKAVQGLDEHAFSLLRNYDFPGNVRELESIMAHAIIMADDEYIHALDLPDQVRLGSSPRLALPNQSQDHIPSLADVEEQHIRQTLQRLNGNQTRAAGKLGISRSTLWRKMQEYNIDKDAPAG